MVAASEDSNAISGNATISYTTVNADTLADYDKAVTVNMVVQVTDDDAAIVASRRDGSAAGGDRLQLHRASQGAAGEARGGAGTSDDAGAMTATSGDTALVINTDASPQTKVLEFSAMNWNTAQVVTVSATYTVVLSTEPTGPVTGGNGRAVGDAVPCGAVTIFVNLSPDEQRGKPSAGGFDVQCDGVERDADGDAHRVGVQQRDERLRGGGDGGPRHDADTGERGGADIPGGVGG